MILADTSMWIELINGRLAKELAINLLLRLVTCGPITQEVIQGLRAVAIENSVPVCIRTATLHSSRSTRT